MDLAEIITAAVEKRVSELVDKAINGDPSYDQRETTIEQFLQKEVGQIAKEEVRKHSDAIRNAITSALSDNSLTTFEINAYTTIKLPKPKKEVTKQ